MLSLSYFVIAKCLNSSHPKLDWCVDMERKYEYIIKVDNKEVWRGKTPKDKLIELKKKNPNKKVSIAWESDDDILVVVIS